MDTESVCAPMCFLHFFRFFDFLHFPILHCISEIAWHRTGNPRNELTVMRD